MWLDLMTLPNAIDRGFAHAVFFSHRTATPMSGTCRASFQCGFDYSGNLVFRVSWLASPPRSYFPQTVGAFISEARTPKRYGLEIDLQLISYVFVSGAI